MATRMRLAAIAAVLVLSQNCRRADAQRVEALPNEERLKRIIHETITPKPASYKPLPADVQALLAWSKPVDGLVARIEYVSWREIFFVRLKNVSDRSLTVPTGNPADAKAPLLFEAYSREGSHPWVPITAVTISSRYFPVPYDFDDGGLGGKQPEPADHPWVTLEPGKDCIAVASGREFEGNGEPKILKVILRAPDGRASGRWSGVLETPPAPLALQPEQYRALRAAVPFPEHFPPLSYSASFLVALSGQESAVFHFENYNRPLIDLSSIYQPAAVCKEFERRMQAERIIPMKLVLASIAAPAGSEAAALYVLQTMKGTDYRTWKNLHDALQHISWKYGPYPPYWEKREPPAWLAELLLTICSDDRSVTGLEKTIFEKGTSFKIADEFGMLPTVVEWKYRGVVPLLNERVKNGRADSRTWSDLAQFGDERAIPALIELLRRLGKEGPLTYEETRGDSFERCAYALAELKAHDAVPVLITHVEFPGIIENLKQIGDERALPVLKKLVADNGRIVRAGRVVLPDKEPERLFAAKLALAQFDPRDEVVQLGKMIDDADKFHRLDVLSRLERLSDPRAIPILVHVVMTDSDHWMIQMSIRDLGERKYKAAVEGLIGCLDRVFKEEYFGKGEHVTPATYPNLIACSLRKITGQSFGADKQQWLTWWRDTGRHSTVLK